jgi:hypothetical protein
MSSNILKTLSIPASSVAPLIGLDHYNNFAKIVCDIWAKFDKVEFARAKHALTSHGINTASDTELDRTSKIDAKYGLNITSAIKSVNSLKRSSEGIQQEQTALIKQIKTNTNMTDAEKTDIIAQITSSTNKMHGVNNEADVLSYFESTQNCKIVSGQSSLTLNLGTSNITSSTDNITYTTKWSISGRYDGLTNNNELVEAKKRVKGLFNVLRDYENIQVQLYLSALKLTSGYLIESYCKNTGDIQCNIIPVQRDDIILSTVILPRLKGFIKFFGDFMGNSHWKNEILKGDNNRAIYNIYVTEYFPIHK